MVLSEALSRSFVRTTNKLFQSFFFDMEWNDSLKMTLGKFLTQFVRVSLSVIGFMYRNHLLVRLKFYANIFLDSFAFLDENGSSMIELN